MAGRQCAPPLIGCARPAHRIARRGPSAVLNKMLARVGPIHPPLAPLGVFFLPPWRNSLGAFSSPQFPPSSPPFSPS